MKIKAGETRILTLMLDNTPQITTEYNVTARLIVTTQGKPSSRHQWPILLHALKAVEHILPQAYPPIMPPPALSNS